MLKTVRTTTLGAVVASLMAAGAIAGAGAAQADPAVVNPPADGHGMPTVNIGDPWGFGEIPLYYGNGAVCAGNGGNGATPTEEIHITFRDARQKNVATSLDLGEWMPQSFTTHVDWHNEDTGQSGSDTFTGIKLDGFARIQPGVGNVTGTITATASILPGGGSVQGIGSRTIEIPFETYSKACAQPVSFLRGSTLRDSTLRPDG